VSVDPRRAGLVAFVVVVAGLLVGAAGLALAAHESNARAKRLGDHGVRVEATVTTCLGQLGGSGSNAAGYTCRGRFRLDGSAHDEVLPGSQPRAPGDTVVLVSDSGHPGDLATPEGVAAMHPGLGAYGLPAGLAGAGILLGGGGARRYRSGRRRRGLGGV
jgi:hypothetical protein